MSLKMKMIPINCCDSRRSLYQNIYSLFYFRLSSILYHPCEWVCFSSLATSHICIILKNKINEALFSPSLSYILNYSQYYSTWFMDSIYSHFPLNLPFVFTITLVLPFSFLITTENVFYIPQKTFDFSMIEQFITVLMRFCWVQNNDFNNSGLFLGDKLFYKFNMHCTVAKHIFLDGLPCHFIHYLMFVYPIKDVFLCIT